MSAKKPVLYYTLRSPPCRAVLLTAAALGLELELREINLKAREHQTPEFLKLNPQHTIPVLVDGDIVITDSHIICGYLSDTYAPAGDDSLYPKAQQKRMDVDARLYFDAGHLFPRVRFMVEPVIYFGYDTIAAEKVVYMQKSYDGLEHCLATTPYLCGEHLTIADLCCVASMSTAHTFAPIDAAKFPKLLQWLQRMSQLPYYQEKNQVGADMVKTLIEELLVVNKKAKEAAGSA